MLRINLYNPTKTFAETESKHSTICQFQLKSKLKLKNRNPIKAICIDMSIYHILFLYKYHTLCDETIIKFRLKSKIEILVVCQF